MLRERAREVEQRGAGLDAGRAALELDWRNALAVLDQIDAYKQAALGAMRATASQLGASVEDARALARDREPPLLPSIPGRRLSGGRPIRCSAWTGRFVETEGRQVRGRIDVGVVSADGHLQHEVRAAGDDRPEAAIALGGGRDRPRRPAQEHRIVAAPVRVGRRHDRQLRRPRQRG